MSKFKVCMLGAFAVGKTSLVQRYVHSIFSERYQTTLGVKIDKKNLQLEGRSIEFILWDLAGEDDFINVRSSYLRGSAGGVLVADGTRAETLDIVFELRDKLYHEVGEVPVILIVNKSDLRDNWTIDSQRLEALRDAGWQVIETSARDSSNVDQAFEILAGRLLALAS
jgi:small GTP-binding protein